MKNIRLPQPPASKPNQPRLVVHTGVRAGASKSIRIRATIKGDVTEVK